MPIYAYRCEACGFAKDVLQKMSDAPLTDCLSCGKPTFRKQVTAAGFQLKGSGWYVTDFRGGNSGKPAPATDSGVAAAPSSDSAAASDSAGTATAPAVAPTTTTASPASGVAASSSSKPPVANS